jgi:hypothetical protein
MDEKQLKEVYPESYEKEYGKDQILTIKDSLN